VLDDADAAILYQLVRFDQFIWQSALAFVDHNDHFLQLLHLSKQFLELRHVELGELTAQVDSQVLQLLEPCECLIDSPIGL